MGRGVLLYYFCDGIPSSMEHWHFSIIILFREGDNYLYLYIVLIHSWYWTIVLATSIDP